MFGKSIVVKNGEHQGLVESVRVRQVFKLEGFVEERIQCFSVDFCFKLLPLLTWQQKNLKIQALIRT